MFVYGIVPGALQTTNATPNTENDCFFIAAGTVGRSTGLQQLSIHGKGAGLTAVSGITFRVKKWTTTASSGGTAITPSPRDATVQASKCTASYAVATVTSGTGGPTLLLSIGCGASGPGGWVAPNIDSVLLLESQATPRSLDIFNASGTASLNFELACEVVE